MLETCSVEKLGDQILLVVTEGAVEPKVPVVFDVTLYVTPEVKLVIVISASAKSQTGPF